MKYDRVLVGVAFLWSTMSTCSRLSVGCVVADGRGKILGHGYNGTPPGQDHCRHVDDSPCTRAVHAEMNAIAFAYQSVAGSTLYTTHSPCSGCVNLILAAGIGRVVYVHEYRDTTSLDLLRGAGVSVEKYEGGEYET